MKILTDLHHHALAESELLLFQDRFGWDVRFPFGMDWYDREIWNFERAWHGDKVARQYLLGWWDSATVSNSYALKKDPRHPGRTQVAVALDAALDQQWDIVICSLPHNYDGFYKFAKAVGAHYGIQIGNNLQALDPRAEFILASSTLDGFGPEWAFPDHERQFKYGGIPTVMYHQEFSLDYFRYEWPPKTEAIGSFVNCFPEGPSYPAFQEFARQNKQFDMRVYGAYGSGADDEFKAGDISFVPDVAQTMRDMRVIWHSKHWSDGYGHTIHNAFSVGRPVIGIPRYYKDKLASPLFQEGYTSFDIEQRSSSELAALLRALIEDDEWHHRISSNAAIQFRKFVDFDADAEAVKELMAGVL